jgi:hypothetical protein
MIFLCCVACTKHIDKFAVPIGKNRFVIYQERRHGAAARVPKYTKKPRVYSPTSQANVAIGIDFGTTNSSIAFPSCSDEVQLAKFPYLGA